MSAKSILILLTGGAALGGLAFLQWQQTSPALPSESPVAIVAPAKPAPVNIPTSADPTQLHPSLTGADTTTVSTVEPVSPVIAKESPTTEAVLAQIEEHFAAGDTSSLRRIAEQLRHPQTQVRLAAREALRGAGDRAVLPDIQFELEATADPQESAELQELADYLQLPSYTELQAATPATTVSRAERQRVTAPLVASRTTSSAQADAVVSTAAPASTTEQLAQLQAENQRLKQENAELRALITPLAGQ